MNIISPITSNPALAFLPVYRWDKHMRRARRECRIKLAAVTADVAAQYQREQIETALSEAAMPYVHHRSNA